MRTLLIVDDEKPILESLRFALEDDYRIVTAHSAEECLKILADQNPDLIMTDYKMPGMTGIQLLERLAQEIAKPAIFLYSAFMTPELSRHARALGATACFSKPFDLTTLRQTLADVLVQ